MGLRIGKLRHRLTLEQDIGSTYAGMGTPVPNWQTVSTVWGSVEPVGGNERMLNHQVRAGVTHQVRIRWLNGVKPAMRFKKTEPDASVRTFFIESVLNFEERDRELHCLCIEEIT